MTEETGTAGGGASSTSGRAPRVIGVPLPVLFWGALILAPLGAVLAIIGAVLHGL